MNKIAILPHLRTHYGLLAMIWLSIGVFHVTSPWTVSEKFFCFRSRECAIGGAHGPFKPYYNFSKKLAYGDISNMHGAPQVKHYRRQNFVSDEYGWRNPPGQSNKRIDVVLLGQSFAVGELLSEGEHYLQLIDRELKLNTYNYAYSHVAQFLQDSRFIDHPPKLVIFGDVENYFRQPDIFASAANPRPMMPQKFNSFEEFETAAREAATRARQSKKKGFRVDIKLPEKTIVTHFSEPFYKGVLFALNLYDVPDTIAHHDRNSGLLFYRSEVFSENLDHAISMIDQTLVNLKIFRNYLRQRNVNFAVMPIPEKSNFYNDFVPQKRDIDPARPLRHLYQQLEAEGIPTFRAYDILQQYRQTHPNEMLYFLDDTHINAKAHQIIYDAIKQKVLALTGKF